MAEKVVCKECGKKFDTREAMKQHYSDVHEKKEEMQPIQQKKKIGFWAIGLYAVILLIVAGMIFVIYDLVLQPGSLTENIGAVGSDNSYQDFKMYVQGFNDNLPINFSQQKYQLKSAFVRFENGDGDVIHKYATGVTLGFALKTIGISLTNDCITMDTIEKFCNQDGKVLKVYVNNETVDNFAKYELRNFDKILVTYGNWSDQDIDAQLKSITNKASEQFGALMANVGQ